MKAKRYHWFARENEILLDLDTPEAIEQYRTVFFCSQAAMLMRAIECDSITTGHKHVFITLQCNRSASERIELSEYLGSDSKRASADRARLAAGAEHFQCLVRFDKPAGVREPDMVCLCPVNWKGVRLRACTHLRNYEPHKYWSGTQTKKRQPA